MQGQKLGHNAVTDLLLGAVARGARLTDGTASGQTGPLRTRVYRRESPAASSRPLVVNFHGGGWVLGSLDGADWLCSSVAVELDAVVVSVDYRLRGRGR